MGATMDATKFVLETRQDLLDYANDYTAYAARLSQRLRSTKKRLKIQDKNPAKHHSNVAVSPSQLAQNPECAPSLWSLGTSTHLTRPFFTDSSMRPSSPPNDAGPSPWPGDHETGSTEKPVIK